MESYQFEPYSYNDEFPAEKNIAIALFSIAIELRKLSFNNATGITMGAIEGLSVYIKEGLQEVAQSIEQLSETQQKE